MRRLAEFVPVLMTVCCMGCATVPTSLSAKDRGVEKGHVAQGLDAFHLAASQADASAYLGWLAPNAIFVGTDATEHWDRKAFADYVNRYFGKGKGWKMSVEWRRVILWLFLGGLADRTTHSGTMF